MEALADVVGMELDGGRGEIDGATAWGLLAGPCQRERQGAAEAVEGRAGVALDNVLVDWDADVLGIEQRVQMAARLVVAVALA